MSDARWRLRLSGRPPDLEHLARVHWSDAFGIHREDDSDFLDDPGLEALDLDDAFNAGLDRIEELNAAAAAFGMAGVPVALDGITQREGPTHMRRFAFDAVIVGPDAVSAGGGCHGADDDPAPDLAAVMEAARSDPRVGRVLRAMAGPMEWIDLRRIEDVIRNTMTFEGVEARGWAKRADLGLIHEIASDPRASGDAAAHGVAQPGKKAPQRQLPLPDARQIVRGVAVEWLRWMAAGQPELALGDRAAQSQRHRGTPAHRADRGDLPPATRA